MKELCFVPRWKMWRMFREMSCGHFSLKLRDENQQTVSPKKIAAFFACVSETFRLNFALGDHGHNNLALSSAAFGGHKKPLRMRLFYL